MASGQDVRDILALPSSSKQQQAGQTNGEPSSRSAASHALHGAAHARHHPAQKKKKPRVDGISRELYALLGDNTPSLTLATGHLGAVLGGGSGEDGGVDGAAGAMAGGAKFMPKFKRRPQRVQKWVSAPFRNPARQDGLVLRHWVPVAEQEEAKQTYAAQKEKESAEDAIPSGFGPTDDDDEIPRIYRFSDLNTNSGVYRYSSDEYHQHLRDEDWTKEETDYLLDTCAAYDLRFVIIADRYEWPGKQRTMEDLKARYYAICRRLIRSRISADDADTRQQLLLSYSFDRAREVERKKHILRLFSRTPQQLAEEEALYVEARRLEQNEAKFAAEREELLRLLGGWERLPNVRSDTVAAAGSGVGTAGEAEEEAAAARTKGARKRKAEDAGDSMAVTPTTATSTAAAGTSATLSAKQKAELRIQHFDEMQNITRFDPAAAATLANSKPPYPHLMGTPSTFPPVAPVSTNPSASHGAYLRSTRMLAPRSNLALRTQESLAELDPPVSLRLTFPTRANCEKWEAVVGAVTSGLEMKRQLDRVQSELRVLYARSQGSTTAAQAGTANGARASSAAIGTTGRSVTPKPPVAPATSSAAAPTADPAEADTSAVAATTLTAAEDVTAEDA